MFHLRLHLLPLHHNHTTIKPNWLKCKILIEAAFIYQKLESLDYSVNSPKMYKRKSRSRSPRAFALFIFEKTPYFTVNVAFPVPFIILFTILCTSLRRSSLIIIRVIFKLSSNRFSLILVFSLYLCLFGSALS